MNILSRVAAVVATSAVATSALVGGTLATADAAVAPVDTTYNCPVLGTDTPIDVTVTISLPKSAKARKTVASRPFAMEITVPADLVGTLGGLGVTALSGRAENAKFTVGKTAVAVKNVKSAELPLPAAGSPLVLTAKGKSAAFKVTKAGTYAVKVPSSFSFVPLKQGGEEIAPGFALSCALTGKAGAGTFKVTK